MTNETVVPDLYALAFIPGVFRCPTCGFVLSKSCISTVDGAMGTREEDRQSEPCPNDGTYLVHVAYRDRYEEEVKRRCDTLEAQSKRFDELLKLEPGWDSYGASRIDPRAVEAARNLLWILRNESPSIVPTNDGGIQVEWHDRGIDCEIEVSPGGVVQPWEEGRPEMAPQRPILGI